MHYGKHPWENSQAQGLRGPSQRHGDRQPFQGPLSASWRTLPPCEVLGQRPGRRTLGASVCTSPCCTCSISLGLLPVMTSDEVPNWS
ncbi:hypothetical protein JZ751_023729 [Albula glossodonta]|uniref:Uncharacterized protein n=1 Tax=Albula glossodonta TaxID=121402 RepID=A0A8T2NSK7_9TELE|nr:hypothetical protein JZ751_023729 [Albula glossodonta]